MHHDLGVYVAHAKAEQIGTGAELNVGKYDSDNSVPVCGRAGEPSGTTILVCDFGVPSLMVVSIRLQFSTAGGGKHEALSFN